MATKITVTLARDPEDGTKEAMAETLGHLVDLGVLPLDKVVFSLICPDQDATALRDDIAVALTDRPFGVEVKIKRTIDEEIERRRMVQGDTAGASHPDGCVFAPS